MRKHALLIGGTLLVCAMLLTPVALAPVASAQASADFDLTWNLIAGGGGRSTSPEFVVNGSVGQPAAGPVSGGEYVLSGGFWCGVAETAPTPPPTPGPYTLYLPIVIKNFP